MQALHMNSSPWEHERAQLMFGKDHYFLQCAAQPPGPCEEGWRGLDGGGEEEEEEEGGCFVPWSNTAMPWPPDVSISRQ